MKGALSKQFFACGDKGFAERIECGGKGYLLEEVMKHDFFAATAVYRCENADGDMPRKIVLKRGRGCHFLGMPLRWLGVWMQDHEVGVLRKLNGIGGTPKFLSLYGKTGFLYEYIEGRSLDRVTSLDGEFFEQLKKLLAKVHERKIVYFDLNKKGNIIAGADGKPYMIDFQISVFLDDNFLLSKAASKWLRELLQRSDTYHLYKQKKRFARHLLTEEEKELYSRKSLLIRLHRMIADPYKTIRRAFMRWLYRSKIIEIEENVRYSGETDPKRFASGD
ncbi:MAG: hypothetical protein PHF37_04190 [Phycisphaerae bacterium]|nr:hypothetical protein [Phycisphaerae bacterium]